MKDIIHQRLEKYSALTIEDEQVALKEILQEILLYALSSSGFFNHAVFNGGTSLRILHGLNRFSEDMDFLLKNPNPSFKWQAYHDAIHATCEEFGLAVEVIDKTKVGKTVQKMFLKDNSLGKLLNLTFHHHPGKKLVIKFEVDINPPQHSSQKIYYHNFPLDFSIVGQDLASNFSGKLHALLCRQYLKGRDWFDFLWYVRQKVEPNYQFLQSAINQQGPWVNTNVNIDLKWLESNLATKIQTINWDAARNDVLPFLDSTTKKSLDLWSEHFFMDVLSKI